MNDEANGADVPISCVLYLETNPKARGIVQKGDVYAITCGEPMGTPGGTNMLKICRVG